MRTARDGTLERYPSICGAGSIASLSAIRAAAASQAPCSAATRARCPSTQYKTREVARRSGRDDRVGQGCVCARHIADREAREGQLPQREVPPRAIVPFELDRSSGVRQRVVRPTANHARLGASPARPRMKPCHRAACPRTLPARRHPRNASSPATSPAAISSQAASTASHGWASRIVRAQAPGPCSDRRTVAGPVKLDEAVADQRGDEVGVACREGVIDGALDGVVRLVPRRGSPVEGGHPLRLADRELPLEEVAQERVVAVRPAVVVHQQGRACELPQDIGRPVSIRHDIAQRRGQLVEDRRAGQERDLGRGAALEHLGSEVVVDEVVGAGVAPIRSPRRRPGSEDRERQQGRPPFGLSCQARRSFGRQPQPEFASEADGLTLVHRQLRRTDLEQ